MKINKILTFFLIPLTLLICIFSYHVTNHVYAADNYLIELGTGQYHITVTNDTTVSDISKTLGEPKLVTPSAFGGNAYTFYTDDEYNNYLYVETTEDGKIISFASVDPTYKTPINSYGDNYSYQVTLMQGMLVNNSGKIAAGLYYNKSEINFNMFDYYENTYMSNKVKYLKGMAQQATVMYNAFSAHLGKSTNLKFNEEFFYINEQLKEFSSSLREYILDTNTPSTEYKSLGIRSNVSFNTSNAYLVNPMVFASLALNNSNSFGDRTNVFFDYDVNRKLLYGMSVSSNLLEQMEEVDLTNEEENKLLEARKWYQKYLEKIEEDGDNLYEINPYYDKPETMVAGKLLHSRELAIVYYLNAIRTGIGSTVLEYDEDAFNVAQHMSTYLAYRYEHLGLEIEHVPPKIAGLSDEYYNVAVNHQKGYAENLGRISLQTIPKAMKKHINEAIYDNSESPQVFSHRLRTLDPKYSRVGFGITSIFSAHEFGGTQDSDLDINAWPGNGITALEALDSSAWDSPLVWTVQFLKNYKVQTNTTATIELINDGTKWEFTTKEHTSSYWFQVVTNSIQSINNKVVMYDSSIKPEEGQVYEVTLHNVLDENTGKLVDYTYRTVFKYLDPENSTATNTISKVTIDEPTDLELDKSTNSYKIRLNEEVKLNASIDDEEAIQKILTWTSSNPEAVSVTQNGTLVAKKASKTPVTITVYNEVSGAVDTISVLPVDQYNGKTPIFNCTFSEIVNKDYNTDQNAMKQDLVIKDGTYTLQEGVDYETKYEFEYDENALDKVRLTITGIGDNYTESKQFIYSVNPIDMKILDIVTSTTYNGKMQSPSIAFDAPISMMLYNYDNVLDGTFTSIEPEYKNAGTYTYAISARPKDDYKYNRYDRKDLQFTINKLNLVDVTVSDVRDYKYTGEEITPSVTLTYDGYTLKEGVDYNLTYKDNKNPGTATIVLEGINNCEGVVTKDFEITQSDVYDISFNKTNINMPINTTTVLNPIITPNFDVNITYKSSVPSVATVDQTGKVTALKTGTTVITATAANGKKASITINVTDYLMGDMNNNGRIDVADIVVFVKLYFNKIESNSYYEKVGDMNYNGRYDVADLVLIVKTYFGKI